MVEEKPKVEEKKEEVKAEAPKVPEKKETAPVKQKSVETPEKKEEAPKSQTKNTPNPEKKENLEEKITDKNDKVKDSDKKEDKKPVKKPEKIIPKKDEARAFGRNLRVSKKQAMYICSFIKNKKIDQAIQELEQVKKMKKAVPFKGEIPHRKGKGMMSGRYPVKAADLIINTLKALKGNTIVNGMDLDRSVIFHASANWAARPVRRGNVQAKRTHVILKSKEVLK